jgi:hypothetical protein
LEVRKLALQWEAWMMGMEVVLSSVSVSRARLHAVKLLLERQRLLLPERQVCLV